MADRGRPTDYTPELAKEICETIASSSKGLIFHCRNNSHWPNETTIRRWVRERLDFCPMYAQARLDQADHFVEECLEISDDIENDYIESEYGLKFNSEHVQRSRLRIDTRKWLASKFAPKVYGDMAAKADDGDKPKDSEAIAEAMAKYEQPR